MSRKFDDEYEDFDRRNRKFDKKMKRKKKKITEFIEAEPGVCR